MPEVSHVVTGTKGSEGRHSLDLLLDDRHCFQRKFHAEVTARDHDANGAELDRAKT